MRHVRPLCAWAVFFVGVAVGLVEIELRRTTGLAQAVHRPGDAVRWQR